MAEFQMESGGGGTPPSHPSKKKGLKIDKTLIYVIGAILIVVFLLFRGRSNTQQEEATTYITDGYPDNDVNYDAKLSNFENIMTGQVDATLNGFAADLNAELNQMKIDIGEANKELLDKQSADYQSKLDAITKANEQLAAQIKNLGSQPSTPAPQPTPQPSPAAPSGPGWLGALTAGPKVGGNLNVNTSIVDRLKSKGYASDFDSRARLAAAMGIGGYTGTSSQNVQMLNNLKSAGL